MFLFFFLFSARQTRTPRVTRLSPPQPALADQANRVSFASTENLETMSEPDLPVGFNRMNRLRQSLPLTRSSSHAKLRAPGQSPHHTRITGKQMIRWRSSPQLWWASGGEDGGLW